MRHSDKVATYGAPTGKGLRLRTPFLAAALTAFGPRVPALPPFPLAGVARCRGRSHTFRLALRGALPSEQRPAYSNYWAEIPLFVRVRALVFVAQAEDLWGRLFSFRRLLHFLRGRPRQEFSKVVPASSNSRQNLGRAPAVFEGGFIRNRKKRNRRNGRGRNRSRNHGLRRHGPQLRRRIRHDVRRIPGLLVRMAKLTRDVTACTV